MKLRFRNWGTTEWTLVTVQGEDDHAAAVLSILGAALKRFHIQLLVDGKWENLGE